MTLKKNGIQINKYVNIAKAVDKLTKMIYLNATKDITIDLSTGTSVLKSAANDTFQFGSSLSPSSTNGTSKTFTNLPAGYYFISTNGLSSLSPSGSITYQSDSFPCFHDPAYPDYQLLFAPCIQPSSPSQPSSSSPGMPTWKITLIAVGAVAFLAVVITILTVIVNASPKKAQIRNMNEEEASGKIVV